MQRAIPRYFRRRKDNPLFRPVLSGTFHFREPVKLHLAYQAMDSLLMAKDAEDEAKDILLKRIREAFSYN
jgi:hypothetical protein